MLRIALIGTGNLAVHLADVLTASTELSFVQWIGRRPNEPEHRGHTPYFTDFQKNIGTDICIMAVQDDQISTLAHQLQNEDICVVHTSGAMGIDALDPCKRQGVFYPLQSFLKNNPVAWNQLPICIEANNKRDMEKLKKCADAFSSRIHTMSSEKRAKLHLAAVFANNFTNHMVRISQDLCKEYELPEELLSELLQTTLNRVSKNLTSSVQTGPAKRNDVATMEQHLSQLDDDRKDIYKAISNHIYKTYS